MPLPEVPTSVVIEPRSDGQRQALHGDDVAEVRLTSSISIIRADPRHLDERVEQDRGGEGQHDGRDGAEQHEVGRRLPQPLEHELAEAAGADQRRDRDEADVLHEHDAYAGEDDRHRQRKLDAEQALAGRHAHAARRLDDLVRDLPKADDHVGHDRQQRIEKERDQRRRRADAADARPAPAAETAPRAAPAGPS